MIKLTPDEKRSLHAMLSEPLLNKVMYEALSEVGKDLDNINDLNMERAAMAYQVGFGARGVITKIFEAANIPVKPQIAPRKLQHRP